MELGYIEEKGLVEICNDFLLGSFTKKICKCDKEMLPLGKIYNLLIYICPCATAEIVKIKDYENMIRENDSIDQVALSLSQVNLDINPIKVDEGKDPKDIDWADEQDSGSISIFGSKNQIDIVTKLTTKKRKPIHIPDAYQIYYETVLALQKPKEVAKEVTQDTEWQEDYTSSTYDAFIKYQLFQIANPKCIIRYKNNGKALYFTEKVFPKCCTMEMVFEFQFMAYCVDIILKDRDIKQFDEYDWGTVICFYCTRCGEYKAIVQ